MAVIEASLRLLLRNLRIYMSLLLTQKMDYAVSITAYTVIQDNKKDTRLGAFFVMVEMAVIETASENQFPQLSTSVVCLLRFPSESAGKQALSYGIL